jgi:hypothetical protein
MSISLVFDTQENLILFLQNKKECEDPRKLDCKMWMIENERLSKELLIKDRSYAYLTANHTSLHKENNRLCAKLVELGVDPETMLSTASILSRE